MAQRRSLREVPARQWFLYLTLPLLGLVFTIIQLVAYLKSDKTIQPYNVTPVAAVVYRQEPQLVSQNDLRSQSFVQDEDFLLLHQKSREAGQTWMKTFDTTDVADVQDIDTTLSQTKTILGSIDSSSVDQITLDHITNNTAELFVNIDYKLADSSDKIVSWDLTYGRNDDGTWELQFVTNDQVQDLNPSLVQDEDATSSSTSDTSSSDTSSSDTSSDTSSSDSSATTSDLSDSSQ